MVSDISKSERSPDKVKSSRKLKTDQKKPNARGRRQENEEAQASPTTTKRGGRGAGGFAAQ